MRHDAQSPGIATLVETTPGLCCKARQGTLAAEEQAELDSYLHVDNLISLMQSKARLALKKHDQGS